MKVYQKLLEDGYKVSLNTIARYRQELSLKAVLAIKQVNTTIPIKAVNTPARYIRSALKIYIKMIKKLSEVVK
jgi:hypothetical protein